MDTDYRVQSDVAVGDGPTRVRAGMAEKDGTILVPLDGSGFAENAIPYAISMAAATRAKLRLLRVAPPLPCNMRKTIHARKSGQAAASRS